MSTTERYENERCKKRVRESTSPEDDESIEENDSGLGGDKSELSDDEREQRERSESPIPEGQYEVEKILDYVRDTAGDLYLVKWKGWDEEANTWEPPSSLANCFEALYMFYLKRKSDIEAILEQSTYTVINGKRRRKGPALKIQLPPDPRPILLRAEAFYAETGFPSPSEVKTCEELWKRNFLRNNKKETLRWSTIRIDRSLVQASEGKLSADEQKLLRQQLLIRDFDEKREAATSKLLAWEQELNTISENKPLIKVENTVDWAGPPTHFTYINDYKPSPGIKIPDDPPMGCTCENCYEEKKTCCVSNYDLPFAYSQHKKLRVPVGTPIYECNSACKCGTDCPNRVVQDGRTTLADLRLCIFRTSNGCGWGVKTLKAIKKGTFVSLYLGEVIRTEVAEIRGREYDAEGCTYLFDLDFNEGDTCPYTVDAAAYGNITHFINHSCDPNLAVFNVWVNCLDPNLPKLALFAVRDISRGEELTFDYKRPNNETSTESQNSQEAKARIPCLCGAKNCRQFLF